MSHYQAVVVGASAGGVDALLKILGALPRSFSLPIIGVLHLPEDRDSQLAEVFEQRLQRPVRQAVDKAPIEAGVIYFAGPGYHLSIERDLTFSLSQEDRVHHSRPSIDLLFASAADAYAMRLVGVLLTGASQDGAQGLACIARAGGLTLVQDPAQAQMPVMPEAALALFRPDHILSLHGIGTLLAELERPICPPPR
jgi:two-component system chemotaxis response regulator CheB